MDRKSQKQTSRFPTRSPFLLLASFLLLITLTFSPLTFSPPSPSTKATSYPPCCRAGKLTPTSSPSLAHAYTEISEGPEVIAKITPESPGANTDVEIVLQSFSIDLDDAVIAWYEDGVKKIEGPARKTYTFRTGQAGKSMRVAVTITWGTIIAEKVFVVNPADVDLVWEASTYTPAIYKGKAPISPGSTVLITAIPSFVSEAGGKLPASDLVYTWERDFSTLHSQSGKGKRTLAIEMKGRSETTVKLSVREASGALSASNKIILRPTNPVLRFYEEHPLLGTKYERALGPNFVLRSEENTLRTEPYGMYSSGEPLMYKWLVDGRDAIEHQESRNLITVRKEKESKGRSTLSLTVSNPSKFLTVLGQLIVSFGE